MHLNIQGMILSKKHDLEIILQKSNILVANLFIKRDLGTIQITIAQYWY